MNTWEYSRLTINWVEVTHNICKFTRFLPGGREQIASSGTDDTWKFFDSKVNELGRDGWELVSVTPRVGAIGGGATTAWHLWFKRPLPE
jgi:cytochrome b involved in lipid metabolism